MERVTPQIMPIQTNYKPADEYAPKYRYMRIPLNNQSGNTVTITPTSTQTMEWKLPIGCYNLNKSFLSFIMTTGRANANNHYNYVFQDVLMLAQYLYFGSGGGLGICDLNYANNYSRIIRKDKTKFADFITQDFTQMLNPSALASTANIMPVPITGVAGNPWGLPAGASNDCYFPFIENQYLSISAAEAGGGESVLNLPFQIPLGAYSGTILGMDKDLFFPIEMYLRVWAGPGNKMMFDSTSANAPAAGNSAAPANNITITAPYLYLAIEQNEIICNSIISKVRGGGMKLQIPYTYAWRTTSSTAAVGYQIQLTRQYGKRLKRMIWAPFNGTELANTAYDNVNYNGLKIQTYQTFLDNRPLTDFQLSCLIPTAAANNQDDWRENLRFFKDSVLLAYPVYSVDWHHNDYFHELNRVTPIPEENIDEGLDMDTVHLWQVLATANGAINLVHYNFGTFVRDLMIYPSGIPALE